VTVLTADPLALLRTRTSTKWAAYPPDVLPMFVAEMDYPVAPEIAAKLVELVARSDLGYDSRRRDLGEAFAAFAADAWNWSFDPKSLKWTVNVMHAMTEITRAAIEPGDRVLINTPVYSPFFWAVREAGGTQVDVPLRIDGPAERGLDLPGIEAAFRDGVKVYLLCNPHNPIGFPHARELGWGDEPAKRIVREAKVALTPGVQFGDAGKGFARLNYACSPEVLEDGVRRIATIA
jgi:cystathionine beta-lyase